MTRHRNQIAALVAVAVVVAALLAWALVPASESAFLDYVAGRRAAGLPTTLDELTGPMPADADNAATELEAAVNAVHAEHGPASSWTGSAYDEHLAIAEGQDGPTDAQLAPLTPIVASMRPALERVEAALEKPHLRFPATLDADGCVDSAHVRVLQEASKMLSMAASAEDDPARRLAACRAALVLGRRIEGTDLLDCLVAQVCVSSGVANLRRGLRRGKIDPTQARAACDELLRGPAVETFRRAARAEPVGMIERYSAMLDGRVVPYWSGPNIPASARWEHHIDRFVRRLKGLSPEEELFLDYSPGKPRIVVAACRAWDAAAGDEPRRMLVSGDAKRSAMSIVLTKFCTQTLRADAQTRLARVALALAERRSATGAWPETLDELRGAFPDGMPLDPFTDAPFVYVKRPSGARLASAGTLPGGPALSDADLIDRGGLLWEWK